MVNSRPRHRVTRVQHERGRHYTEIVGIPYTLATRVSLELELSALITLLAFDFRDIGRRVLWLCLLIRSQDSLIALRILFIGETLEHAETFVIDRAHHQEAPLVAVGRGGECMRVVLEGKERAVNSALDLVFWLAASHQ